MEGSKPVPAEYTARAHLRRQLPLACSARRHHGKQRCMPHVRSSSRTDLRHSRSTFHSRCRAPGYSAQPCAAPERHRGATTSCAVRRLAPGATSSAARPSAWRGLPPGTLLRASAGSRLAARRPPAAGRLQCLAAPAGGCQCIQAGVSLEIWWRRQSLHELGPSLPSLTSPTHAPRLVARTAGVCADECGTAVCKHLPRWRMTNARRSGC